MKEDNKTIEPLVLEYDLYSLPTAQHKAGLAGLLIIIDSMKKREMANVPEILEIKPSGAKISFSRESMQALFDDFFDAAWVEVESKSKWAGKEPNRIEEKIINIEGEKNKKEKRFIYDAFQPKGAFLNDLYGNSDAWLKLWRDMLWNTLRSRPTTRNAYEDRANNIPAKEAQKILDSIEKSLKERAKGKIKTESIASSVFIGAQDVNAEKIPFQGLPETNLLLYFWVISAMIYAPKRLKYESEKNGGIFVSYEDAGYVIVVPEPSNLEDFIVSLRGMYGDIDKSVIGYRPKESIIHIPSEGGLEFLYLLSLQKTKDKSVKDYIDAVEVYYLERLKKKNVIHSLEKITPDSGILRNYEAIRNSCFNPIYKSIRISNILAGRRWYAMMENAFNIHPSELFIKKEGKTPISPVFFGSDALKKFKSINETLKLSGGVEMDSGEFVEDRLASRIYGLVNGYVLQRAESKTGISLDVIPRDAKNHRIYPKEYREAREKICSDAFLAIRGRRDQDFIEYFTGTICSVPQYLPSDDFLLVSQALLTDWEKVKALSMLALSACSWTGKSKETNEGE